MIKAIIALTGGPCGGKTTALARIPDRLRSLGYNVFIVPEAATVLLSGGGSFVGVSDAVFQKNQLTIARFQLALEDGFREVAQETPGNTVILCDRGLMDGKAFCPPSVWQGLIQQIDKSEVVLRDKRYDAVLHLVSAADGAEAFYNKDTNAVRYETAEQAKAVDLKLRDAWLGHPHFRIIDNSTDFMGKMQRVDAAIANILGVPEPMERERRFLVDAIEQPWPVKHEAVQIRQQYLLSSSEETERIRTRGQDGMAHSTVCTHTIKRPVAHGEALETERQITMREYNALLSRVDPSRHPIKKERHCFLWKNRYFELDIFQERLAGWTILEVEVEDINEKIELPPFIRINREITGDHSWSNHALASL